MIVTIVGKISWLYLHIIYSNNTFYFLLPDIILPNPLRPPPTTLPRFDTAPPAAFVILPAVEFRCLCHITCCRVRPAFVILPVGLLVAANGAAEVPCPERVVFVILPAVEFALVILPAPVLFAILAD